MKFSSLKQKLGLTLAAAVVTCSIIGCASSGDSGKPAVTLPSASVASVAAVGARIPESVL